MVICCEQAARGVSRRVRKFWRSRLRRIGSLRQLVLTGRRLFDPHTRALVRIEQDAPGMLMQPSGTTYAERYPEIFAFLAAQLAELPRPNILSYGCSSGEEVFALRRALPHARLTGIDINPRAIARAQRRLAAQDDSAMAFELCTDPAGLAQESYDAVLCMAVMRHGGLQAERPPRCDGILSFARAEAFAAGVAALVRPGGLLALWHVHFRFGDMAAAAGFEPVLRLPERAEANQPLYGPGDVRLDGASFSEAVWRRL